MMMKKMTASARSAPILNELIFTLRMHRGRRLVITAENAEPIDRPFVAAIAKVLEIWFSRTWR